MKKKLLFSMIGTLTLSLILVTVLFISIINYEYKQNVITNLNTNNDFVKSMLDTGNVKDLTTLFKQNLKSTGIRVTYIDKNGNVIADSVADEETMNNHNDREEVISARKNGTGFGMRQSKTVNINMMYVATAVDNGYIIRSSMPIEMLKSFEDKYIKYYAIIVLIVLLMAALFSSKLSQIIIKPIKDLEHTTALISKGEFSRRIETYSKDEIGELGKTFNNMADRLENTLNDVIEKQNRLEAILKSMDSGVIAVDRNYKIIMINPYAENIFGIKKNIIGQNLMDIIRDFEIEDTLKNSLEDYKEIRILWPKERVLRMRTADIINNGHSIGKVAVIQDITDVKRLENVRSQFVANVSHELKTPLTSIKGFAETLRFVEDPEKKEKFLDIINEEAERLTRLINDILILSDIENNWESRIETVDVNESMLNVYNLMKNVADSRNIELTIVENNNVKILGDKDKFKQMLINLVDNAIKYSEPGDKVYIGNKIMNNKCRIWVEDTGTGIPKEHLGRLFERFYRVDKARSRAKGGTGLGLAIVKHIVLGFKGTIDVESKIDVGSKFTIELPIKGVD